MSSSDVTKGRLIVESASGVEIRILDTAFTELARGTVRLEAELDPGLYLVNWKTAGQLDHDVVRLREGQERLVLPPGKAPNPALPPLNDRAEVDLVRKALHEAPGNDSEAEIVVLVAAELADRTVPAIQLFARDDLADAMPEDRSDLKEMAASFGGKTTARAFSVAPAVYRLRFSSTSGETLDQSVPAIGGRRTVVFMRAAIGKVLVVDGEQRTSADYHGIEASHTAIVTLTRGAPARQHAEAARIATVLLDDLAFGRTSLGEALLGQIEAGEDPLLRLYAAAVIVQRVEAGKNPSLDDATPPKADTADQGESAFDPAGWLSRAAALIAIERVEGLPADFAAVRWRIGNLGGPAAGALGALRTPPMLDCAWRWATMRSTVQPDTIPSSVSFRAATLGSGGTAPWLAWRTAAAKSGAQAGKDGAAASAASLRDVLMSLAQETVRAVQANSAGRDASEGKAGDPLAALPLDLRALAASALQAAASNSTVRGALSDALASPVGALKALADRLHMPPAAVEALAGSLQMPASALQAQAQQAIEGLQRGADEAEAEAPAAIAQDEGPRRDFDSPALAQKITVPDDPHKGRFGGQASVGGYTLSASFGSGEGDWVKITLAIEAPAAVSGEAAIFYLHSSFIPDRRFVPFDGRRATIEVQAWGGFTVGAWVPNREIELELDLALIEGAPRIVREL